MELAWSGPHCAKAAGARHDRGVTLHSPLSVEVGSAASIGYPTTLHGQHRVDVL